MRIYNTKRPSELLIVSFSTNIDTEIEYFLEKVLNSFIHSF